MRKNRSSRGVNVIAMVLMLITFFLVIGFGIGAISTMNLNLSARSVNTVKANKLAEGAAAAFLEYVEKKSEQLNQTVSIDDMSLPNMRLDLWYNGARNVFDPWKNYMGDNCAVDVHFNTSAPYFSTDNSFNRDPRTDGAYGYVPPFTIDLIITVNVGDFTKHYQVWINRKWDYAIYTENGPMHLLESYDISVTPPTPLHPSFVEGNIYSKFYPPDFSGHPLYLFAFNVADDPDLGISKDFMIRNWMPNRNYPASITIGALPYVKKVTVPPNPPGGPTTIGYVAMPFSTNNSLQGRGAFEFAAPTPTPSPHLFVYPNNSVDTTRSTIFKRKLMSPFLHLKLIDAGSVGDSINQNTRPDYIDLVETVDDNFPSDGIGPLYTYTVENIYGCTNVDTPPPDSPPADIALFNQKMAELATRQGTKEWRYFLKKSFTLSPTSQGHTKFVIDGEHGYLPLCDKYTKAQVMDLSGTTEWRSGQQVTGQDEYGNDIISHWRIMQNKYEAAVQVDTYQPEDNPNTKLVLDNTMLIAKANINLETTAIQGDNALLQVEADLAMKEGKLSAGQDIGAVIYCNNFYCGSNGDFKGVIMVKQAMKVGRPKSGSTTLHVKGGVAVKGDDPPPPALPTDTPIFDHGGLVATGFEVVYDPFFMRFLNRFGYFRVACWIDRD